MSASEENWTQYSEELYLLRDMFLSLHLEHHASEEKYRQILNGYKIGLKTRNRKWEGFDYVRTMNVVEFIESMPPAIQVDLKREIYGKRCMNYNLLCGKENDLTFLSLILPNLRS